jgi:thermitase
MTAPTPLPAQPPYEIPDCGCGDAAECIGPDPVPWLPWQTCFNIYEFRTAVIPLDPKDAATNVKRLVIRITYEHQLCLLGRKQGPIVHSLTLLPKEELKLYEYDRYRSATSVEMRFSWRTSFFDMTQQVTDAYSSATSDSGGTATSSASKSKNSSGGFSLGFAGQNTSSASASKSASSGYFDVANVSTNFSHVAHTSSLAVESERSIVVSTFTENETVKATARTIRNDNPCRAVTYFIRKVFEVYRLKTRIVAIDVEINGQWLSIFAVPQPIVDAIKKYLGPIIIGMAHDPKVEISLPTDGLLYEAELAHCCSCDCEAEAAARLQLEKTQLENLNLRLEAERRQARLDAGNLDPFEPVAPTV